MSVQNKALRYVFVIGLPEWETELLFKNLSREDGREVLEYDCQIVIYDLQNKAQTAEEDSFLQRKEMECFLEDFKQFPPELALLVTGEPCCLELADTYDMASVGYLAENGKKSGGMASHADMYVESFLEVGFTFLLHVYERHHQLPWKILETKRCIVQEFSMEWLPDLFELYAGDGMTDYIEPLYEYEKEKEYQEAYIRNMYPFYGYGMWIVREKETGGLIGRAGLECREEMDGSIELGYVIGTPYQRQGYATEVCYAILQYAKEELSIGTVCCLIEAGNKKSVRLARKLGFRRKKRLVVKGKKMIRYEKNLNRRKQLCLRRFCLI